MTTRGPYEVGQVIQLRATFRDPDDVLTTPTTRACLLRTPVGAETAEGGSGTVVSPGIIDFTLPPFAMPGTYIARIEGEGGILPTVRKVRLQVEDPEFVNP